MTDQPILLVEDNADDELLTTRAFKKNRIMNEVVVARDGGESIEYIFGTAQQAGGDMNPLPQIVLLDLNLPRISGLDVLRRIRGEERTKSLPVVVLTLLEGGGRHHKELRSERTDTCASPSTSMRSTRRSGRSGSFGSCSTRLRPLFEEPPDWTVGSDERGRSRAALPNTRRRPDSDATVAS